MESQFTNTYFASVSDLWFKAMGPNINLGEISPKVFDDKTTSEAEVLTVIIAKLKEMLAPGHSFDKSFEELKNEKLANASNDHVATKDFKEIIVEFKEGTFYSDDGKELLPPTNLKVTFEIK